MEIIELFVDWWRGYSDEDIQSLHKKQGEAACSPGMMLLITDKEMKALRDGH